MTHTPRLTQVDHASIPVGDVEQAVDFYGGVLGLAPITRPDFDFPGAWFGGGSIDIHLTTNGTLRGADSAIRPNEAHVAFRTDDDEAMLERLAAHGVSVWEMPNSPAARRQIFFNDPWGNMLEIIVH